MIGDLRLESGGMLLKQEITCRNSKDQLLHAGGGSCEFNGN
jgi:hypothetical protein